MDNNVSNYIPCIETERLKLRRFTLEDAADYFNYHNSEEVLKYYDWKPETLTDAQNDIMMIISGYEKMDRIQWAVINKENNRLIGDCGIILDTFGLKCEINYILSSEYWGIGMMTEALSSIISYCFNEIKAIRIQALSHPENLYSSRLLKRLGFTLEGLLSKYGYSLITKKPVDLNMWSLLRD